MTTNLVSQGLVNAVSLGQVDTLSIYTIAEIERRLRLSKGALRTARRQGLKIRRIGRRSFILGEDLIQFLRDHAKVV